MENTSANEWYRLALNFTVPGKLDIERTRKR
jgi:hypothetical protein